MKKIPLLFAFLLAAVSFFSYLFPVCLPVFAGAALVCLAAALSLRRKKTLSAFFLTLSLCLAVSVGAVAGRVTSRQRALNEYEGKTVTVSAVLTRDATATSNGSYRCQARPKSFFSQNILFFTDQSDLRRGTTVRVTVTLSRPTDEYLFSDLGENVLFSCGTARDLSVQAAPKGIDRFLNRIRDSVHSSLFRFVSPAQGGWMEAVLTGNRDALTETQNAALTDTGLLHLVAVSGLHVSVFLFFLSFLFSRIRNLRLKAVLTLLCSFSILFLSGFSYSVFRALLMSTAAVLSGITGRTSSGFHRLGLAAAVLLLARPYGVFSLSFLLSFAATFGILLCAQPLYRAVFLRLFTATGIVSGPVLKTVLSGVTLSLSSFVFTLPLLWVMSGRFSVCSVFLTPFLLPVLEVCFALSLLLILFGFLPFLEGFLSLLGLPVRYGVLLMEKVISFFASHLPAADLPLWLLVVLGSLIIIVVSVSLLALLGKDEKKRKRFASRALSLLLAAASLLCVFQIANFLAPSFVPRAVLPDPEALSVSFLNVGQGSCTVVLRDGRAAVFDCGGDAQAGKKAVRYLKDNGICSVDLLVLSHFHSDHTSGLPDLLDAFDVSRAVLPDTPADTDVQLSVRSALKKADIPLLELTKDADATLAFGDASVSFLTRHFNYETDEVNDNCLVSLLSFGDFRLLVTADSSAVAQTRLLSAYPQGLRCDLMTVPHHGSRYAFSSDFLAAASPLYAVCSVGLNNDYGHPAAETAEGYKKQKIRFLRTDYDGTLTFITNGKELAVPQ